MGEPRITQKGKMVRNITKHYLCIGPTNIKHFDPFLCHFSMNMGALGL